MGLLCRGGEPDPRIMQGRHVVAEWRGDGGGVGANAGKQTLGLAPTHWGAGGGRGWAAAPGEAATRREGGVGVVPGLRSLELGEGTPHSSSLEEGTLASEELSDARPACGEEGAPPPQEDELGVRKGLMPAVAAGTGRGMSMLAA